MSTRKPPSPEQLGDLRTYATLELANGRASKAHPGALKSLVARGLMRPTRDVIPETVMRGGKLPPQRYSVTPAGWRALAEAVRDGALRPITRSGRDDDDLARYLPAPATA